MKRADADRYSSKHPGARLIDSEVAQGVTFIIDHGALGIEAGYSGRLVMDRRCARDFARELLEVVETLL